jgi:hypothetical protein
MQALQADFSSRLNAAQSEARAAAAAASAGDKRACANAVMHEHVVKWVCEMLCVFVCICVAGGGGGGLSKEWTGALDPPRPHVVPCVT